MNPVATKNAHPKLVKALFLLALITCLFPFVNGPVALISGFLFTHFLGHPYAHLNRKAVNWLLKIAVVGLGFSMNIQETLSSGKDGLMLTILSITLILTFGFMAGKFLKLSKKITHLISVGTAICGGSAIAAVAPVVHAEEKDISVSLGVVFFLNSVALLLFPPIGKLFHLTQQQFGLWSALAIHDTSSVVGAAQVYGTEALKVATTAKLARTLWITPISIISVFMFRSKQSKANFPLFILVFIGIVLLNSYFSLPGLLIASITGISKSMLVLTLFLVGAGLSANKIKSAGWKPMLLGISLWLFVSIFSLVLILAR